MLQLRAKAGAASSASKNRIKAGLVIRDAAFISGKFNLRRFAFGLGRFKELFLLEAESAGQQVGRKSLDLRVQVADHSVVVAARILNGVFELIERILQ